MTKMILFVISIMLFLSACTSSQLHTYTLSTPIAHSGPQHILLGQPMDLNSADATMLESLPGVGPVLAQKIVQDRNQRGPFRSVAELQRVSGVGERLLARVSPYVAVPSKP